MWRIVEGRRGLDCHARRVDDVLPVPRAVRRAIHSRGDDESLRFTVVREIICRSRRRVAVLLYLTRFFSGSVL